MITLREFIGLYTNVGDMDEITIVSISGRMAQKYDLLTTDWRDYILDMLGEYGNYVVNHFITYFDNYGERMLIEVNKEWETATEAELKGDMMEEFIFDVLLLVIGIMIGRGFTLDQIEDGRR